MKNPMTESTASKATNKISAITLIIGFVLSALAAPAPPRWRIAAALSVRAARR
jgi:hypothetical protein